MFERSARWAWSPGVLHLRVYLPKRQVEREWSPLPKAKASKTRIRAQLYSSSPFDTTGRSTPLISPNEYAGKPFLRSRALAPVLLPRLLAKAKSLLLRADSSLAEAFSRTPTRL